MAHSDDTTTPSGCFRLYKPYTPAEESKVYRLEPRETYDQFIIGVATWKPSFPQAIVYDQDALIEHLARTFRESDPELDEDQALIDAQEHFDFNIVGSSTFSGAPRSTSPDQSTIWCSKRRRRSAKRRSDERRKLRRTTNKRMNHLAGHEEWIDQRGDSLYRQQHLRPYVTVTQ
jgi:hypothetical protein